MRKKRLGEADRALWERVKRDVKPLKPVPRQPEGSVSIEAVEAAAHGTLELQPPIPTPPSAEPAPVKPRRRPGDVDKKTRRKLTRGAMPIEARIDLHGMTQEEAHRALISFIETQTALRRRMVLVITGKGVGGEGRGVLRRAVPEWLLGRELVRHVVSYGPAAQTHGGDGALYVRLRGRSDREAARRR